MIHAGQRMLNWLLFLLYLHVFLVKFCLFVSLLFNVSLEKICLYADIEWYKQAFTCFMFYSLRKIRESSLEIMCGTPSEYYSVLILVRHLEYPFRKIIHLEKVLVPNCNFWMSNQAKTRDVHDNQFRGKKDLEKVNDFDCFLNTQIDVNFLWREFIVAFYSFISLYLFCKFLLKYIYGCILFKNIFIWV